MGALHAGHLSLIDIAQQNTDRVVASIYVNPKQFAPGEDFDAYPRTLDRDASQLVDRGCHLIFAPTDADMYPSGACTTVSLTGPAEGLESTARPHFFDGVATVVTKLLTMVRPDVAVFGEKDYQQLIVIKRLVMDLGLDTAILSGPTTREPDGLAMSSRNAYLTPGQRKIAATLNATLRHAASAFLGGVDAQTVENTAKDALLRAGFTHVDYVALRQGDTLQPIDTDIASQPETARLKIRLLAAAHIDTVRLIDNIALNET